MKENISLQIYYINERDIYSNRRTDNKVRSYPRELFSVEKKKNIPWIVGEENGD